MRTLKTRTMDFVQNVTDARKKPILRTYLNLVRFLNDYFLYRKDLESGFSYELWAEELGFKSKASVRMICQGKRNPADSFLRSFSQKEKLDDEDYDYLQMLDLFHKAKTASLKKNLLEKLIEKFDVSNSQKHVRHYIQFLSRQDIPLVQMLISFSDFHATEKNLSTALNMDTAALAEILKILTELDLVQEIVSEKTDEPYWVSKTKLFKIPGEISDPAIQIFHEQTMNEAQEKVRSVSLYHQFRSLYFSLDDKAFQEICQTLNDVANRLKVSYCNNHINNKRLFKFNFQLYPITDLVSSKQTSDLT